MGQWADRTSLTEDPIEEALQRRAILVAHRAFLEIDGQPPGVKGDAADPFGDLGA